LFRNGLFERVTLRKSLKDVKEAILTMSPGKEKVDGEDTVTREGCEKGWAWR